MTEPRIQTDFHSRFLILSLIFLITGMTVGVLGSFQYLFPGWLKSSIPFNHLRPVHVFLVISWIITAAIGGIYYYMPLKTGRDFRFGKLATWHFVLLVLSVLSILYCFFSGIFGGREYLEYPPALGIFLLGAWVFFAINFLNSSTKLARPFPVYIWMWLTGIFFFTFSFLESFLWLIPFFRDNVVRDMTVQWKSLGSFVGSWNMLVYGTAFYMMEKIGGDQKIANSRRTFFFYFLGLTNLMFNWGHHTYILPASGWIRNVSYIISMTELLILFDIIRKWKVNLNKARKDYHHLPSRLLAAADFWILVNLVLAIALSVPFINQFTHGTHFTVAHAMGATIGINTTILLASLFYILELKKITIGDLMRRRLNIGYWLYNISLFVFWISLLGSGIIRAIENWNNSPFTMMVQKLIPMFRLMTVSGIFLLAGTFILTIPLLKGFIVKPSKVNILETVPINV